MAGPSPGMLHQRGHPSGGKAAEPEQHGMKLRSTPPGHRVRNTVPTPLPTHP